MNSQKALETDNLKLLKVYIVTVVFIHTMENDQRLNTLVHEGDTQGFPFSIAR